MIDNLTRNRVKFETLAEMMLADTQEKDLFKVAQEYVTYYQSQRELTINEQRLAEYRILLEELELHSVTYYPTGGGSVVMTAYAQGWSPEGGTYKGYEFFPSGLPDDRQSPVADSLDDPQSSAWLRRKIDENWYLWYLE